MGKKRAEFVTDTIEPRTGVRPGKRVTRCRVCGWETSASDASLYGTPGALTMAKLGHRLDHLEGRTNG